MEKEMAVAEEIGFLRLSGVLKLIPVSRSSWYAGVKNGKYPAPYSIGPRTSAYKTSEIYQLIKKLGTNKGGES